MSRSGYTDDYCDDTWAMIRAAGARASALRGKRGQAFLRELLAALDAMPVKELIAGDLVTKDGACCAMGAVAKARGCKVDDLDPENSEQVAQRLGIAAAMASDIAYENDDDFAFRRDETPAQRWTRMRAWAAAQIIDAEPAPH